VSVNHTDPVDTRHGQGYDKYRRKRIKLVLKKSTDDFDEIRCDKCNALLFKSVNMTGTFEVKCRKCKQLSVMTFD
jgi:formylmethanofuran dehydrogenase subunit E